MTISAAPVIGPYTVTIDSAALAASVLLNQAAATLEIDASASLQTSLTLQSGTLHLYGGLFTGTINGTGGSITASVAGFGGGFAGTLQSTTILGAVTLTELLSPYAFDGGIVQITGGLTLGGATPGTLTLAAQQGNSGVVELTGTEALNGGTLWLDQNMALTLGTGASATLGGKMVVDLTGSDQINDYGAGVMTNAGLIVSSAGSNSLAVSNFTNTHLLEVIGGSTLTLLGTGNTFTNSGVIGIGAGSELIEEAGTFTGSGKITVAAGGTYGLGGPNVTLAQIEQPVYAKGAFAALFGTLQNTGSLTVGSSALPNLILKNASTITGGTLVAASGLQFFGGTLANVAIASPLDIGAGTVTLAAGTGFVSGGGSVTLAAQGSLALSAGLTLTGLTLEASGGVAYIGDLFGQNSAVVLKNDVISIAASSAVGFYNGGTLVNQGTIAIATGGTLLAQAEIDNTGLLSLATGSAYEGQYNYYGANIVNTGSIVLTGTGAQAIINLTNSGLLSVGAGATAVFASLANTGSIAIAGGGTFALQGTISSASLGATSFATGAVLDLLSGSAYQNAGTLAIGTGTALGALAGQGLIEGGTIADHGNGLANFSGTLGNLTYAGILVLDNGQQITLDPGVTFTGLNGTGAGAIVLGGGGASLSFAGGATLNATNVTVNGSGTSLITGGFLNQAFTIGKTVRITETGGNLVLGASTAANIINQGRITDTSAFTTLTLGDFITNSGQIFASNGTTLVLDLLGLTNTGSIGLSFGTLLVEQATLAQIDSVSVTSSVMSVTGALSLGGGTLSVSGGPFAAVSVGAPLAFGAYPADINGGTVIDATGATLFGASAELTAVTWQGILNVSRPLTQLALGAGFSMTGGNGSGSGTINLNGIGASITAGTLANAVIGIGAAETSFNGTSVGAATLNAASLAAGVSVTETGAYANLSTGVATFTSAADITAAIAGGQVSVGDIDFATSGTIAASHGATITLDAAQTINTGVISAAGTGTVLSLSLYNYYAQNMQGASLANNGKILLTGGTIAELTDNGAIPAVALANAGLIAGYGALNAPLVNSRQIVSGGGTLAIAGNISGTGTLAIGKGSEMKLTSAIGQGQSVTFGGVAGELGLSPAGFLGTLSGLASGDKIDLLSTAASAASFHGNSIVVTLSAGGTFTLATSTAETGTITVASDGAGASLLTIAAATPDVFVWHG